MTNVAQKEFHTINRHYHVGDDVLDQDVTLNVHELCLTIEKGGSAPQPPQTQKFTVTLKANGGTGADVTAQVNSGEEYTLPASSFTAPKDKVFKSWNTQANGQGTNKNAGEKLVITKNTDIFAIWKPVEVTIKFNANGGTGTMADVKKNKGEKYTLPECTFTAPGGKKFKGWSTDKSAVITEITADNTTVFALWQPAGGGA